MAGITIDTAEARLQTWLDAEAAVASGQSISMQGRRLDRANLAEIGERIAYWDKICKSLSTTSIAPRISRVVGYRG